MKLPDFTKDAGLNTLRQLMGASLGMLTPAENRGILTKEEIDALTKQGIEVSLDAVHVLADGTLAYKNSRVILYIRDIAYYRNNEQVKLPRFHIADCKTLETMRANNRFDRYVVATREDGLFALNVIPPNGPSGVAQNITERLPVCQNCLGKLRWDGFGRGMNKPIRDDIVDRFSISRFFSVYGKTFVTKSPQHNANTAPINTYSADFTVLGDRLKAERRYCCDDCGINLSSCRKYLHAHHKDGRKHDSRPENIAILCIACHAEQYNHRHIKASPDYIEFMRLRSSIFTFAPNRLASSPSAESATSVASAPPTPPLATVGATTSPNNWVAAAQEVARAHKLGVQDLRKDGGCLWVEVKNASHPAAILLKKLGFQFSVRRQAYWRKD